MSAPSIPKRVKVSASPLAAMVAAKTGSSHWLMRLSPSGRPRMMPRKIVGMASRMSGTVIAGGDSWIVGSTAGSTLLLPQNVRPMSRNM